MEMIDVEGGQLCFEHFDCSRENGAKMPWVFVIPGMCMSTRPFEDFCRVLSLDFNVLCLNHRDTPPTTARAKSLHRIKDVADDVFLILKYLKIDTKSCVLVGESFGGMVALGAGLKRDFLGLCVINSSVGASGQFRLKPVAVSKIFMGALRRTPSFEVIAKQIFSAKTLKEDENLIDRWIKLHEDISFPYAAMTKQLHAGAVFRALDQIKSIKTKTLIVYGSDDSFVPVTNSFILHENLANSNLLRISGGHHLSFEKSHELANGIRTFIDSTQTLS